MTAIESFDNAALQGDDLSMFEKTNADGQVSLDFVVPDLNCAGCMSKIERYFSKNPDILVVRANLTQRMVHFEWRAGAASGGEIMRQLGSIGFPARPYLASLEHEGGGKAELRRLIRALAVAGFAAANVMLLSVSIWAGADGATRDLFHWISALIALPAIAYAGQPFFTSAWRALRARGLNMDVPISLAVILASGISLYETMHHGEHAFFDAAITLLFFLLIGRVLDRMMRERAFSGVRQLLALKGGAATVVDDHGRARVVAMSAIEPGMVVLVRPGETIAVDGEIIEGRSDIDWSLVNGEPVPRAAQTGDEVFSGLINLTGPLRIKTQKVGDNTLLAEIIRLMDAANESAPKYAKLADRAASIYAPLVHLAAAATFIGWMIWGAQVDAALYIAISVLIITCPCALGLAVPVVQVVASSIAHRRGVLMKDGSALEKLSEIDIVVFDKTGTLTLGRPKLIAQHGGATALFVLAGELAGSSVHPLSKALSLAVSQQNPEAEILKGSRFEGIDLTDVKEFPGQGLRAAMNGAVEGELRIGSLEWCDIEPDPLMMRDADRAGLVLWVSYAARQGKSSHGFYEFEDEIRPGAEELIDAFQSRGLAVQLLSGDRKEAVSRFATRVGIKDYRAEMKPSDKAQEISKLGGEGRKVLMIGDGINDGPALKAAYVSLSPANASDVAQVTAGFLILGESLKPVIDLYKLASVSKRLIYENFLLAIVYNIIAIPIAVLGFATPIVAAIAMSLSSMVVTLNALRLHYLMRGSS